MTLLVGFLSIASFDKISRIVSESVTVTDVIKMLHISNNILVKLKLSRKGKQNSIMCYMESVW